MLFVIGSDNLNAKSMIRINKHSNCESNILGMSETGKLIQSTQEE